MSVTVVAWDNIPCYADFMMEPATPDEQRTVKALSRIFRPIVRLLIARGIHLPAVTSLLKQAYVDVALADFSLDGKPPTDSRVSVLTGVHRRDVRSIRRDGVPSSASPSMALSATVVGRWLGDPAYADKKGTPVALHRLQEGGAPSFEVLVQGLSKDVHPRTVLDDLINQGLVTWDQTADAIRLRSRAFVPTASPEELMKFFEMNLHDHLAAATANLLNDEGKAQFLERAVYYNHLLPGSVDSLEIEARKQGDKLLHKLNSKALQHQTEERQEPEASERFRFGIFFYREQEKGDGEPT